MTPSFLSLLVTVLQLGAEQGHQMTGTCIPNYGQLPCSSSEDCRTTEWIRLWEKQLPTELRAPGELDTSDFANKSCFLPEEQQQSKWFTYSCIQVRAFLCGTLSKSICTMMVLQQTVVEQRVTHYLFWAVLICLSTPLGGRRAGRASPAWE